MKRTLFKYKNIERSFFVPDQVFVRSDSFPFFLTDVRALYKDLVTLFSSNRLISQTALSKKVRGQRKSQPSYDFWK